MPSVWWEVPGRVSVISPSASSSSSSSSPPLILGTRPSYFFHHNIPPIRTAREKPRATFVCQLSVVPLSGLSGSFVCIGWRCSNELRSSSPTFDTNQVTTSYFVSSSVPIVVQLWCSPYLSNMHQTAVAQSAHHATDQSFKSSAIYAMAIFVRQSRPPARDTNPV